ncbi:MAG: hypothetical protein RL757_2335 [Bacteroidota bacterium]|jgi:hypothetical protein
MNFYWVYDIPNWQFAILTIGVFVLFAVSGLLLLRGVIARRIMPQAHNDVVSYFMAGLNAIYGITLGLIAVGAWEKFNDLDDKVSLEAAALSSLYQDVSDFPAPLCDTLKYQIKEYTQYTIEEAWPKQQKGEMPHGGTERLTKFKNNLLSKEPTTKMQEIIISEAFVRYNEVIKLRRLRLQAVTDGLPSAIWYIIMFGAFLNIAITWFFITDKFRVHVLMTVMFAALLGSLVFLVGAMDNPFRGEFSVSAEAFEIVLKKMK